MDAAALSRLITVRHKQPGHLRLELPPELAGPAARSHFDQGLRRLAGVYRISFDPESRRLSIRFEPLQCTVHDVARQLRALLNDLPTETGLPAVTSPTPAANPFRRAGYWAERFTGGTLGTRLRPILQGALTEKATINFLNDVLMFYLVKAHWGLITRRWLKQPVQHADAWLTTFYLAFLLVRYRKSIK